MITPGEQVLIETLRLLMITWSKDPNVRPSTIKLIADLIEQLKSEVNTKPKNQSRIVFVDTPESIVNRVKEKLKGKTE